MHTWFFQIAVQKLLKFIYLPTKEFNNLYLKLWINFFTFFTSLMNSMLSALLTLHLKISTILKFVFVKNYVFLRQK